MSPWKGGKWIAPTAAKRKERGLSALPTAPTQPTATAQPQAAYQPTAQPAPTAPAQAAPTEDKGFWTTAKEWIANRIRAGTGQLPLEVERQISGVEPAGTTVPELVGLGAAASAPMLVAGALGAAGLGTAAVKGLAVTPKAAAVYKTTGVATGQMTANVGTMTLIGRIIARNKLAAGILVGAGALGAMFWGIWGGVEAPEPTSIAGSKILDRAYLTGDFSLYDEWEKKQEVLLEATDPNDLKNQIPGYGMWRGFTNKWKGQMDAFNLLKMHAEDLRSDESIEEQITRRLREKEESQIRIADYIDQLARARDTAKARQTATERLEWERMQKELLKLKEKMQKENNEFWLKYLKMKIKYWQEGREARSQLGFGLF